MKILYFILLLILGMWGTHQYICYKMCEQACIASRVADEQIVSSNLCKRFDLEPKNTRRCNEAKNRLSVPIFYSAYQKWWEESEMVRVWNILASSYWSMIAVVIPTVLLTAYSIVSEYFAERKQNFLVKKQLEFANSFYESDDEEDSYKRIKSRSRWSDPD